MRHRAPECSRDGRNAAHTDVPLKGCATLCNEPHGIHPMFDWKNPYPTTRSPLFARNVVATSHPLAAQAGLSNIVATKWAAQVPALAEQPGFAQAFMPRGRAPLPGERFVFAEAARSLTDIANTRGESFYRGALAQALAAHSAECGGAMTLD